MKNFYEKLFSNLLLSYLKHNFIIILSLENGLIKYIIQKNAQKL